VATQTEECDESDKLKRKLEAAQNLIKDYEKRFNDIKNLVNTNPI
jgi:hypothetical protein